MNSREFKVVITDLQLNPDGSAFLITKPGKDNPSTNGVHKLRAGQVNRLSQRCLGIVSPIGLKHLIGMSNGSAMYAGKCETIKAGDTYIVKDDKGVETTHTYDGGVNGSWEKTSNEEIQLGMVAKAKVAELSLSAAFAQASSGYSAPVAPVAQEQTKEEVPA